MVHLREDFDVYARVNLLQMFRLRLGGKSFQRPVPVMNIGSMNSFQFVCIDGFVAIQDGLPAAVGIDLPAFVQKDIEIVGMEYPTPKTRPVIASPHI